MTPYQPKRVLNPAGAQNSAQLNQLLADVATLKGSIFGSQTRVGPSIFNIPTTAPVTPVDGDIYFDKTVLALKIYIDDGNSQQWIQF